MGTKNGEIYFTEDDSHEVTIQRLHHQGTVDLTDRVRIEISSEGYSFDERSMPEWYERTAHVIKQKALLAYKHVLPYHHNYEKTCNSAWFHYEKIRLSAKAEYKRDIAKIDGYL